MDIDYGSQEVDILKNIKPTKVIFKETPKEKITEETEKYTKPLPNNIFDFYGYRLLHE